jgi:hypothetical protein
MASDAGNCHPRRHSRRPNQYLSGIGLSAAIRSFVDKTPTARSEDAAVFIWREEEFMIDDLRRRSAAVVFEDHLRLASEHQFEEDIERNVSPDIVILERRGIFRGREGARQLARFLEQELPKAPYLYTNRLLEGRVAFLEWTSEAEHTRVRDGADSFVIENGWIVAQTIHYTVEAK